MKKNVLVLVLLMMCYPLFAGVDLIALYNFTDADYLNLDLSGNFNNLTFSGSPVYGDGVLNFDGVDDYATTSINPAGSFSISFWFKPQKQGAAQFIIFSSPSNSFGYTIFYSNQNDIRAIVYDSVNLATKFVRSKALPAGDSFYHIVLTFEATGDAVDGTYPGTTRLYVDGVLDSTVLDDAYHPQNTQPTYIGSIRGTSSFYGGSLKEFAIYSGVLQSQDIAMLASGKYDSVSILSQDTICVSELPFSYYPLSDPNNLTVAAKDYGTNANDLTFFGNPESQDYFLKFDGVDDYATTNIDPQGSFSISFWFKPILQGTSQYIIRSAPSIYRGYAITYSTANDIRAILYDGTLPLNVAQSKALPAGDSFYNIVLTFEATGAAVEGVYSGTTRLYVDGVLDAEIIEDAYQPQNTSDTHIGSNYGTQYFYNGLLDDLAVWDFALTQAEISSIVNKSATPLNLFSWSNVADMNNDCNVNLLDFSVLAHQWLSTGIK